MPDDIYRPDASNEFLVSGSGERIEFVPHLYFSYYASILERDYRGIAGDTRLDFYRAVRLKEYVMVDGVHYKPEAPWGFEESAAKTDETILEPGSLLIRAFAAASNGLPNPWYVLSMRQQVAQNMMRYKYKEEYGGKAVTFDVRIIGQGCSHDYHRLAEIVKNWGSAEQAAAHIKDLQAYWTEDMQIRRAPASAERHLGP